MQHAAGGLVGGVPAASKSVPTESRNVREIGFWNESKYGNTKDI
jgi:hypothetical protein